MAYTAYPGFSYSTNAYTQTPQSYPQTQYPQMQQNGILWVQGEAGAKSYLVAPNTTVLLMDSEGQKFYLKSTDGAGIPQLRTFEYKEVVPNAPQPQIPQENLDEKFVKREEFAALQEQYSFILETLKILSTQRENVKTKTKGGNADE